MLVTLPHPMHVMSMCPATPPELRASLLPSSPFFLAVLVNVLDLLFVTTGLKVFPSSQVPHWSLALWLPPRLLFFTAIRHFYFNFLLKSESISRFHASAKVVQALSQTKSKSDVDTQNKQARSLRARAEVLYKHGPVVENRWDKHVKVFSLFHDDDFRCELRDELWSRKKVAFEVTQDVVVRLMRKYCGVPPAIPLEKISRNTAKNWLFHLGYSVEGEKKTVFHDNHERWDIRECRQEDFLTKMERVRKLCATCSGANVEIETLPDEVLSGESKEHILCFQDESTMGENDHEKLQCVHTATGHGAVPVPKTLGPQTMIDHTHTAKDGLLRVTDEVRQKLLQENPDHALKDMTPRECSAACFLRVGKNLEGYNDADAHCQHVDDKVPFSKYSTPTPCP